MTLLEAVNLCLRSTGETGVTTIVSAHPQISTILAGIDRVSKTIQARNWWFNTGRRTLEPSGGVIDTTAYELVVPTMRSQAYYPLGGLLIDGATGNPVDHSVEADVRWQYATEEPAFSNLPNTFTDYVGTMAALDYASNYDADPQQIAKLKEQVVWTRMMVNADHTRYSRVNLFWSGSTGRSLNNSYGSRYGRRG